MPSVSPQLSIIMPVKNLGRYLADCLLSIVNQSFRNWELIIVNDHSTDNTSNIITDFIARDSRINQFQNEGHGIIPALQLALKKTKGTYISRFDGDDIMPAHRLKLMIEAIATTSPKTIVTGKVKYFGEQAISEGYKIYEQWLNDRVDQNDHWDWIYRECVLASPNWMVRKSDLLEIGGFDQLSYPEDYDLVLQWYQHGFKVKSLSETTLDWREHADRTSRNSAHYNQDHFFRLKIKHFVNHQLGGSELVLWGTDTKGKLTKSILDALETPFIWMEMAKSETTRELEGQTVFDYRMIEKRPNIKLLIAVFPPSHQKLALERYLDELGLKHGLNYYFL